MAARIFNLGDVAKRALGQNQWGQRDELYRWPAIFFRPRRRSVPKGDRSPLPEPRYSLPPSNGSRGEAKPSA
ncbi:hypothetical protein HYPDE_34863 [Hyphomicrobium denitrificans 1NES1]|uniref:Uncharacterized protein n=1 Tax=Hyphomicrobium denitrificans 1NES1 TaxID=670307 RepID=N0B549_9HYPH|nr:hypothetical protein HYPDE_34863 [Hyphomicrobium denitrificans 1NES1]